MIEHKVQIFKELSNSESVRVLNTLISTALEEFQNKYNTQTPKVSLAFEGKRTVLTWKDIDTQEDVKEGLGFSPAFFHELNNQFQTLKGAQVQNQMAGVLMTSLIHADSQLKYGDLIEGDYKRPDIIIIHFLQKEIQNQFPISKQIISQIEREKLLTQIGNNKEHGHHHKAAL